MKKNCISCNAYDYKNYTNYGCKCTYHRVLKEPTYYCSKYYRSTKSEKEIKGQLDKIKKCPRTSDWKWWYVISTICILSLPDRAKYINEEITDTMNDIRIKYPEFMNSYNFHGPYLSGLLIHDYKNNKQEVVQFINDNLLTKIDKMLKYCQQNNIENTMKIFISIYECIAQRYHYIPFQLNGRVNSFNMIDLFPTDLAEKAKIKQNVNKKSI